MTRTTLFLSFFIPFSLAIASNATAEAPFSPYRLYFSSDLLLPYLYYSEAEGFVLGGYYRSSDFTGNHQIQCVGAQGTELRQPTLIVEYSYLKYFPEIRVNLFHSHGYYEDADTALGEEDEWYREAGGLLTAAFPIDRFHRFETQIGSSWLLDRLGKKSFDTRNKNLCSLSVIRDHTFSDTSRSMIGSRAYAFYEYGQYSDSNPQRSFYLWMSELRLYRVFPFNYEEDTLDRSGRAGFRIMGGSTSDPMQPFALGGEEGLRGFEYHEFHGSRTIIANLEYEYPVAHIGRTFHDWSLVKLENISLAGFIDAGDVWNSHESLEMHYGIGVGVRIYAFVLAKAPYCLRIDLATDAEDLDRQPSITFAVGSLI